jgi:N2227-like protein
MSEIVALQVYGGQNNAGQFDAVLTCFFLDTAHNVLVSWMLLVAALLAPLTYIATVGASAAVQCDVDICRSILRCCTAF